MDNQTQKPEVSVIVAVYNEAENLPLLLDALAASLKSIPATYEIIAVDDGSTDGSGDWLKKEVLARSDLRVVLLRRNYGQTAAIAAGFCYEQGNIVITIDGDLQNDPADIPLLLAKMNEGYDLVVGWRKNRKDDFLKKIIPSRIANWITGCLTGLKIHDFGCSLRSFRAELVADLNLYGELHRFLPALAFFEGARLTEIPVRHHARRFGRSKYGLARSFSVIVDLFRIFFLRKILNQPMHLFGFPGLIFLISGIGTGSFLTILKLGFHQAIGQRPLLLLTALLILLGIQLFCFALLAELLMRTYHESQRRPIYRVREVISKN